MYSRLMLPPPRSTVFPYTTLFRSPRVRRDGETVHTEERDLDGPVGRVHLPPEAGGGHPSDRHADGCVLERRRGVEDRGSASAPDRKSTRLNSSHGYISYAVFCLTH